MRALALALLLAGAAPAQTPPARSVPPHPIVFWNMSRPSVDMLLNRVPQPDALRLAQLRQVFLDLQCEGSHLRPQPAPAGANLICELPGNPPPKQAPLPSPGSFPDSGTILVLAHYEHVGLGQSAVEDWSGALMLPFLYHALAATPRRHTFIFAEVDGQSGAKALFDSFTPSQRSSIHGVIDLDSLGLGPPHFYIDPNDDSSGYAWKWLSGPLLLAAADQRLAAPAPALPGAWLKVDATREFRHHNLPSILIHSVGWNTRDIPGSSRDTSSEIDRDAYFQTIKLLSDYAAELDQQPASPR